MARKSLVRITSSKKTIVEEDPAEALAEYGLERGSEVRFKGVNDGSWNYGTASRIEKDGSLGISTGHGHRSIVIDRCQLKRRGPRGGVLWEPIKKG